MADIARRGEIIRQNAEAKRGRKRQSPEVSDEELDRRALVMMGRIQDAPIPLNPTESS